MKIDGEKYMYGFQCSLRVLKTVFPNEAVVLASQIGVHTFARCEI